MNLNKNQHRVILILIFIFTGTSLFAQFGRRGGTQTITYDELYDDPYDINKLWVGFLPMYGEIHWTNVTAGFGAEIMYMHEDKIHINGQVRLPYFRNTDLTRFAAEESRNYNPNVHAFKNYFYAEVGVTYHIWDKENEVTGNIPLYSKNYKGSKWAAKVAQTAEVPNKRREILGVRLGGVFHETATNVSAAIEKQNVTILAVESSDTLVIDRGNGDHYSSVRSIGFYTGVSYTWIKNFAAKPDKTYSELVEDQIFSTFLDIFVFPWNQLDNFSVLTNPQDVATAVLYDASGIRTFMFGARLGIDGKFNRELGWSYGSEIGIRPGINGFGFYGLLKVSFPVYSTKLDNKVEAFGR